MLGDSIVITDYNWFEVLWRSEAVMQEWFSRVKLIGQIPLMEIDYKRFASLLRKVAGKSRAGIPQVANVPPAVFLTSLVFCARYSNTESREFWAPYAEEVWRTENTQYFQNICRERFSECIRSIADKSHLRFQYGDNDHHEVVREAYHHAIIPAYLQEDFAQWLQKSWKDYIDLPMAELASRVSRDPSVKSLPPRLKKALTDTESILNPALIRLLSDMVSVISLYEEYGQEVEHILEGSPIQAQIWHRIEQAVQGVITKKRHSRDRKPQWIWNIEAGTLDIRFIEVVLPLGSKPVRCEWHTPAGKSIVDIDLYPAQNPDGTWVLDTFKLPCVTFEGHAVIFGSGNVELEELENTPRFPHDQNILPFRRVGKSEDARLTSLDSMSGGETLVALKEGVTIRNIEGNPLPFLENHTPPDSLLEAGFKTAAFMDIHFPIRIWLDDSLLETLSRPEVFTPTLNDKRIEDVSSGDFPVFRNTNLQLEFAGNTLKELDRFTLLIRGSNEKLIRRNLRDLPQKEEYGTSRFEIESMVGSVPDCYTLDLLDGMKSVMPDPVLFSVIPDFTLEALSVNQNRTYTPVNLPRATIRNVHMEHLKIPSGTAQLRDDSGIEITWNDVSQPCRFTLDYGKALIPLVWDAPRFCASVNPSPVDGILIPESIETIRLEVRGERNKAFKLRLENSSPRLYQLDAQGRFSTRIGEDPLIDMIRSDPRQRFDVQISVDDMTWTLFTFIRQPKVLSLEYIYGEKEQVLMVECKTDLPWHGDFTLSLISLSDPMANPSLLGVVSRLDDIHEFRVTLDPDDVYVLQIDKQERDSNARVSLPQPILVAADKENATYDGVERVLAALPYINLTDDTPVPSQCASTFLRHISPLTSETPQKRRRLWQLATLPSKSLLDIDSKKINSIWGTLRVINEANHPNSEFPAWAITRHPLRFYLRDYGGSLPFAYPERVTAKVSSGNGWISFKWKDDTLERCRIKWEKMDATTVHLWLYHHDLKPLYFCTRCGRIVPDTSDSSRLEHQHNKDSESFDDLSQKPLIAEHRRISKYEPFNPPSNLWRDKDDNDYRLAIREVDLGKTSDEYLQLMNTRHWQEGINRIGHWLTLKSHKSKPAFDAAARLLYALEKSLPDEPDLAKSMLLLALLLRGEFHDPGAIGYLCDTAQLNENDLMDMLYAAYVACPRLLMWAMYWSECFYAHAIS